DDRAAPRSDRRRRARRRRLVVRVRPAHGLPAGSRTRRHQARPRLAVPLGKASGGRALRRDDWLRNQLPMGMLEDNFFARFVGIFQNIATSYLEDVDNFDNIVDVRVAPTPLVPWLGSWIRAPAIDSSLPEELPRRVARDCS